MFLLTYSYNLIFSIIFVGHVNSQWGLVNGLPKEDLATAELLRFFNDLFDSVNGEASANERAPLRVVVNKDSEHHKFWTSATKKLAHMRFVAKKTNECMPPSLVHWRTTIESFQKLYKILKERYGIICLKTRHINQDCIENFFGRIRSYNYRNINPSP